MTINVTMKDSTHRAYDGVFKIETVGYVNSARLHIYYYSSNSSIQRAELSMNSVKSFSYGI